MVDKSDQAEQIGQALITERKKTKVLKSALKSERKERATIDSELSKAKDLIEDL